MVQKARFLVNYRCLVFLFYIDFAIKLAKFSAQSIDKKLFIVCNPIVIFAFLKDILKIIFGRSQTTGQPN